MEMIEEKHDSLFDQIEADKKSILEWPDWMKSIAHFSGIRPSIGESSENSQNIKRSVV